MQDDSLVVTRSVKWGECDFAGIAYTPRYADWCVEAIETVYTRIGLPWRDLHDRLSLGSPFVRLSIEFKSPIFLGDELSVRVVIAKIGTSSIHWRTTGTVDDRVVFEGDLVNVIIEKTSGSSHPIPQQLKNALLRHST